MTKTATLLFVSALAVVGGCALVGADAASADQDITQTDGLFGDDRVADALKGKPDKVPNSYAAAEKLFGVGRACARPDSKEVFVVEEAQTRDTVMAEKTTGILPRAIITGCNTPEHALPEANDPQSGSFSLFIALFSSERLPDAKKGDTMVTDRVETIALDRRTGLYNFYVFMAGPDPSGPGVMQRVQLEPNNDVMIYEMRPGASAVSKTKSADRACNNCHVNMGPLMNELHEPWTNWVSTRKLLPTEARLSGETRSIVNEAASLDGSHGRVSFANDLEKTIMAAMRTYAEGLSNVPSSGFAQANIDGDMPAGVGGMLKSVFCQTELQYESGFEVEPLELFVDPGAVQGAQIQRPQASSEDTFPTIMPVRSELNKRIEIALMKKRVLGPSTVLAVRLFDDRNDVFSTTRCGLYPRVLDKLPKQASEVDAHVRSVLTRELDGIPAGTRHDYVKALLADASPDVGAARAAYFDDVRARLDEDIKRLDSAAGRAELKKRAQARKDAATKMFNNGGPLPLLSPEKP